MNPLKVQCTRLFACACQRSELYAHGARKELQQASSPRLTPDKERKRSREAIAIPQGMRERAPD